MRLHVLLAFVGLAISFAVPSIAQQKDTSDPRIAQQRALIGDAKDLSPPRINQQGGRSINDRPVPHS
jgi:hypothetical protein